MKRPKDSSFTISLGVDDDPNTIPRLLRHAMTSLKKDTGSYPVYIHSLQLANPYTNDDDRPFIECSYWVLNKKSIERHREAVEFRKEMKVSPELPTIKNIPENGNSPLRLLEYRLPQDDNQNDTIRLIESVADYLEAHKIENVLDIILKDWLDDDALNHPFIRVYYLEDPLN